MNGVDKDIKNDNNSKDSVNNKSNSKNKGKVIQITTVIKPIKGNVTIAQLKAMQQEKLEQSKKLNEAMNK